MTSTPGLSNDTLQLIDLPLRTSERPKLSRPQVSAVYSFEWDQNSTSDVPTYSLLRQLPCALVLAVPQEFDDTTFIRRETIEGPNMISPRHAVVKP